MHYVESGDVKLAYRSWGNKNQPVLILVHGYPDSSVVWLPLAKLLARNFHVVAYDVRGSGYSDAPRFVWDYKLDNLSSDLSRIINEVSPERPVHIIGHDWGSIQSWHAVTSRSLAGKIASFTSISGPCLDHVGYRLKEQLTTRNPTDLKKFSRQMLKSWYIGFFHIPVIAPLMWQLGVARLWPGILERLEGIQDGSFDPHRKKDGKNGINLYRANILPRLLAPDARYAQAPVQIILPTGDKYVTEAVYKGVEHWVAELEYKTIEGGHWVMLTDPDRLAALIANFVVKHEA